MFNPSHFATTACVPGRTTATEHALGTDKREGFPVVFTAFYLHLTLTDRGETQTT